MRKEFLEFSKTSFIQIISGCCSLALSVPLLNIRILAQIESSQIVRRNGSHQCNIGQCQRITSGIGLTLQECVQKANSLFHFLEILWIGWSLCENLRVVVGAETIVQCSHIEVHALIDKGTFGWVFGIKGIGFAILFH